MEILKSQLRSKTSKKKEWIQKSGGDIPASMIWYSILIFTRLGLIQSPNSRGETPPWGFGQNSGTQNGLYTFLILYIFNWHTVVFYCNIVITDGHKPEKLAIKSLLYHIVWYFKLGHTKGVTQQSRLSPHARQTTIEVGRKSVVKTTKENNEKKKKTRRRRERTFKVKKTQRPKRYVT